MSNGADQPIYSVDSSTLMDWQARYYPSDVFKTLLQKVDGLVANERFVAPALVRDEVKAVGTAGLIGWADAHPGIFVPTADLLAEAQAIQNQFAGLSDPKAEYEEADAYVIALARIKKGIVLTQETAASEKHRPRRTHFMPDVCRELGVPCISFLGLMRREGWIL
jgi:hypothetical protein